MDFFVSLQNEKTEKIEEIWNEGYGVVCHHVFHNTVSEEAHTREAVMILAIGKGSTVSLPLLKYCHPSLCISSVSVANI